jgi:hypothetical protein
MIHSYIATEPATRQLHVHAVDDARSKLACYLRKCVGVTSIRDVQLFKSDSLLDSAFA